MGKAKQVRRTNRRLASLDTFCGLLGRGAVSSLVPDPVDLWQEKYWLDLQEFDGGGG